MSEVPKIITAEEQLAKMREGVKGDHQITMRQSVFQVRVLSIDEMNQIRRSAIQETAKVGGDETDKHVLMQKSTLKMATTISKGGVPSISDKLLSLLSTDEVAYLYNEFIRVMESVNPALDFMEPARFRELVDALKKNEITPRDCTLMQLRVICSVFQETIQKQATQDSQPAS